MDEHNAFCIRVWLRVAQQSPFSRSNSQWTTITSWLASCQGRAAGKDYGHADCRLVTLRRSCKTYFQCEGFWPVSQSIDSQTWGQYVLRTTHDGHKEENSHIDLLKYYRYHIRLKPTYNIAYYTRWMICNVLSDIYVEMMTHCSRLWSCPHVSLSPKHNTYV